MPSAVDTDDKSEPAIVGRLHSVLRALDDDGALRRRAQSVDGCQQDRRIGLAGQREGVGDHAVDADSEQVVESGRVQYLFAVATGRKDRRGDPRLGKLVDEHNYRINFLHNVIGRHEWTRCRSLHRRGRK